MMKFSVVTVTLNSAAYLEDTIKSVIGQTYPGIEYVLIDGGSTDDTLKIVEKYRDRIHYFHTGKDESMYDAINKGIDNSTGDFILVLNSDDVLAAPHVLAAAAEQMTKAPADAVVANMVTDYSGKGCKKRRHFRVTKKRLLLSGHATFLPHPSILVSRSIHQKLNGYSLKYRYASDFDYILRLLSIPGVRLLYVPVYLTKFRLHPLAITASGRINLEREEILNSHGYRMIPYLQRKFGWITGWSFYLLYNADNYIRYYLSRLSGR